MRTYTKSHEWIDTDENIATVGLTKAAISEVGEIVYIELPQVGKSVQEGSDACVIESTKAAVDIASPVTGQVVATNTSLQEDIGLLNSDPEAKGWLFKVKLNEQ